MFLGPFQEGGDFRDAGISGTRRFLDKVWDLVGQCRATATLAARSSSSAVLVKWHQTKKKVTDGPRGAAATTPPSRR